MFQSFLAQLSLTLFAFMNSRILTRCRQVRKTFISLFGSIDAMLATLLWTVAMKHRDLAISNSNTSSILPAGSKLQYVHPHQNCSTLSTLPIVAEAPARMAHMKVSEGGWPPCVLVTFRWSWPLPVVIPKCTWLNVGSGRESEEGWSIYKKDGRYAEDSGDGGLGGDVAGHDVLAAKKVCWTIGRG
jgi:hypothetical protein